MPDIHQLPSALFVNGEIEPVPYEAEVIFLQNYRYDDYYLFMLESMSSVIGIEAVKEKFLKTKFFERTLKGHYFSGPYFYNDTWLNYTLIIDRKSGDQGKLVGISVSTTLCWNGTLDDLPDGWRDSVGRSHRDVSHNRRTDTLVALLIMVEDDYKQCGWSATLIEGLKCTAARMSLKTLIAPLVPPQRRVLAYASMPFEAFAYLKRADGEYQDHWIRLHTRMGARVLKCAPSSRRYIMPIKEFMEDVQPLRVKLGDEVKVFEIGDLSATGEYLVQSEVLDGWQKIFVVTEYDFVLFDQGGLWVEHLV
jgi:hypothetical protein